MLVTDVARLRGQHRKGGVHADWCWGVVVSGCRRCDRHQGSRSRKQSQLKRGRSDRMLARYASAARSRSIPLSVGVTESLGSRQCWFATRHVASSVLDMLANKTLEKVWENSHSGYSSMLRGIYKILFVCLRLDESLKLSPKLGFW